MQYLKPPFVIRTKKILKNVHDDGKPVFWLKKKRMRNVNSVMNMCVCLGDICYIGKRNYSDTAAPLLYTALNEVNTRIHFYMTNSHY